MHIPDMGSWHGIDMGMGICELTAAEAHQREEVKESSSREPAIMLCIRENGSAHHDPS